MKNRKCQLFMEITNDAGVSKRYFLTPIAATELGADFVAGYRIINRSESPSPVYHVRLTPGACVTCTCPAFCRESTCKHASALTAAGLLPVRFIELLWEHHQLLNNAEEKNATAGPEIEALRNRVEELETTLRAVEGRALQLQTALSAQTASQPKRRRTAKIAA